MMRKNGLMSVVFGPANGAHGPANGTQGRANGTQGRANGTQGRANGTQGRANGTQGRANATATRAALAAAGIFSLLAPAALGQGEWEVINLHPAGAVASALRGTTGDLQYGAVTLGIFPYASVWNGSAESWRNVAPFNGGSDSTIYAHHGSVLVGVATYNASGIIFDYGTVWDARSLVSRPIGFGQSQNSVIVGTSGGQHVGSVRPHQDSGGQFYEWATLWNDVTGARTNLHPPNARWSGASVTNGTRQAGWASLVGTATTDFKASIWRGTAASWMSIHPAGAARSQVTATDGGELLGGWAQFGTQWRAGLWTDTAASWMPIHPTGATESRVSGMTPGLQVGYAAFAGVGHAGLWRGTAESWTDLHAVLPLGYSSSEARGVATDGRTITVVGSAFHVAHNRTEAVLWRLTTGTPCDSLDFNNNSLFPEDADLVDFFSVLAGGNCSPGNTCNDIDFNNDGLFPDDDDLAAFLTVLAGGSC